jgi:hypothetical protein
MWEGKAATQPVRDEDNKIIPEWIQEGGEKQIYIPSSSKDIPGNLEKHLTEEWGWEND